MVINTDPAYAYLLEGNSLVDQKLVMAHVYGHVDFFKHNYFFSQTNRKMIDTMANHAARVRRHMARHGQDAVENFIDTCLSLENLIDPMSQFIVREREAARSADDDRDECRGRRARGCGPSSTWTSTSTRRSSSPSSARSARRSGSASASGSPSGPSATLSFLIEHAPLDNWQRDCLEIVRDEAYYFVPQAMTKIMNEGWATYWHSKLMTEQVLSASEIIDYADAASGVAGDRAGPAQPVQARGRALPRHRGALEQGPVRQGVGGVRLDGAEARLGPAPGPGPREDLRGPALYNDVTFIDEFFTLEFCVEQKFYSFGFSDRTGNWEIMSREFKKVKDQMLRMLTNLGQPFIYVEDGNFENRGELLLRHAHEGIDLDMAQARDTLLNLHKVWTRPVSILTRIEGKGKILRCDGDNITEKSAEYPA